MELNNYSYTGYAVPCQESLVSYSMPAVPCQAPLASFPVPQVSYPTAPNPYLMSSGLVDYQITQMGKNADYERNAALIREEAEVDIRKHEIIRRIDEESGLRMSTAKADLQIKKEKLAETVVMNENGSLVKKQEYLLEKPKEYEFANFRAARYATKYICGSSNDSVLCLPVILQNQRELILYLNLDVNEAGYYWRKFRNAGIAFKKKRKERRDMIFDVIEILSRPGFIETVELPLKRGFYITEDGQLHYADKNDLIWKEVKEYAR